MMMNTTLAQLRELRLEGLATGLQEQLSQAGVAAMSFEERLALCNSSVTTVLDGAGNQMLMTSRRS
jgi:hypothetical protein